jgi:serine/threonine-protein kinase RsbW
MRRRGRVVNAPALAERGAAVRTLPGVPRSVGEARAFVRGQLGGGHAAAVVVGELLVSELATNAITHTDSGLPGRTFTVTVRPVAGGAEIAVYDAGARTVPTVTGPGPDGQHGRGVAIVDALAASWGTAPADGGRVTWCRIGGAP